MIIILTSAKLVQSFKEIRVKASETLTLMSVELERLANAESEADRQAAFVDHWKDIEVSPEVCTTISNIMFSLTAHPSSIPSIFPVWPKR